jgi:hypothetical protein
MVRNEHQHPQLIVQLAINEKGILRGNYTDEITDNTLPIHVAVDKETQPAAWTVGGNKQTVMEAGLILQRDARSAVERQFDDFLEQFWIRQPLFSRGRSEFDVLLGPAVRVHFNHRVVPFSRTIGSPLSSFVRRSGAPPNGLSAALASPLGSGFRRRMSSRRRQPGRLAYRVHRNTLTC